MINNTKNPPQVSQYNMEEDLNIAIKLSNCLIPDLAGFFLLMSFNYKCCTESDLFGYEWLSVHKVFTSTLIIAYRKKHWLKIHRFTAHGKCKVLVDSQRSLTFTTGQGLSKIRWICVPLNSSLVWLMRIIVLWQYDWQQQEQQQWQNQIRSFNYALLDACFWNLSQTLKNKLVQGNAGIFISHEFTA